MSVAHTLFSFLHALKAVNHLCTHTQSTHNNSLSLLKVWAGAREVGPALGSLVKQLLVKFNGGLWFRPPLPSHSISSFVIPAFPCCTVLCPVFSSPLLHPTFFICSSASFLLSSFTFYRSSVPALTNISFFPPSIPLILAGWFQYIFRFSWKVVGYYNLWLQLLCFRCTMEILLT